MKKIYTTLFMLSTITFYAQNGTLDSIFGINGKVTTDFTT